MKRHVRTKIFTSQRALKWALSILEASGAYPGAPRSRMRARDPILADSVVLVDGSALSAEYQ